jgi:hypothetical protein
VSISIVSLVALIAVSGLSVILTMKECGAENVRSALVFKVWGLIFLFFAPIPFVEYMAFR